MKRTFGIFLACCLAWPVTTAMAAKVPASLAVSDRPATGGRVVRVVLPQSQIETTYDVGRVASSANGGGLLGVIIISSMDDKRDVLSQAAHSKAESQAAPLRQALQGFDIAGLALATTKSALAKPAWFQPTEFAITNDAAIETRPEFLSSVKTTQYAVIDYRYQTSPDFSHIRVIAEVQLGRAGGMNRGSPAPTPIYRQQVTSIVQLRQPSFEPAENAALWSAGDGKLAKDALTEAFARLETVIPAVLDLDPARFTAVTDKRKVGSAFAAGFYGPQLMRDEKGVVIWSKGNGFVAVQPAND